MQYSFPDEKLLHQAKQRDRSRSKLSDGHRARTSDNASVLVKDTKKKELRRKKTLRREQLHEGRDDATETALRGVMTDKSVKRFVL